MTTKKLAPALLILALLFTGCAGGTKSAATDIVPEDAANTILDSVAFRDSLVKAEGGAAESYYRLDDNILEYAIYISGSGATAEEVAVLKVKDPGKLDDALAILDKRVEDLIFRFEDYVPEEMVKLKDPVVVSGGDTAILVLADDSPSAKKAAEDILK